MKGKIGIVDTTFARINMYKFAKNAIVDSLENIESIRYTVPGIKDLPVASKILIDYHDCDLVLALGMPGPKEIDRLCAHEASNGLISAQLITNKHIIEVFIHENEATSESELLDIVKKRVYDHTINAIALLKGIETLSSSAGQGIRQGKKNTGEISNYS